MKKAWSILRWPLVGALGGYIIGYAWDNLLKNNKALFLAVVGVLIGFLFFPIRSWLRSQGKQIELESVEFDLPFGGTTTLKLTDVHRIAGWKLFIEFSTRIATQSLAADEGICREALSSLYKLFEITRTELKSMKPSPTPDGPNTFTVETYALKMLNDGLRPMLSRWHPRLSKWEKTNLPEASWPLAEDFRSDLESTRQIVLAYTWGLGEILKAAPLSELLPRKPTGAKPELVPIEAIKTKEQERECPLLDTERTAAWHILVELKSRVATQQLPPDQGLISEAIASLYTLFEFIRTELKTIPLPPQLKAEKADRESIQEIGLSILNVQLRPFVAKWHPLFSEWQKKHPAEAEQSWPQQADCRQDLEQTRQALEGDITRLEKLIGI